MAETGRSFFLQRFIDRPRGAIYRSAMARSIPDGTHTLTTLKRRDKSRTQEIYHPLVFR
jgi:hypothetical protein